MAQANSWHFTIKETVVALLREQGITEGHWQLNVVYGHGGGMQDVPGEGQALSLIVQIKSIGLVRVEQPTPFSVDASTLAEKWPDEISLRAKSG